MAVKFMTLKDIKPDAWDGERCFLVGGGPSLRGFDWSLLEGELTIGINRAIEFFKPTIAYARDEPFARWAKNGRFGPEATRRWKEHPCAALWGLHKSDLLFQCEKESNNSGLGALRLAIGLGAREVYLLGYDLGGRHFHKGYPALQKEDIYDKLFIPAFEKYAREANGAAKVVNLNPGSRLRCFDFSSVGDVLQPAGARTEQPALISAEAPEPTPNPTPAPGCITVITPTGDRPLAFALCKQWMANQTLQPRQWIVVDDGEVPLTPSSRMTYIRREPQSSDPPHTLIQNLMAALPEITGDKILIMEDDEYYAPRYIEEVASRLDGAEVAGICRSKYYHLPTGRYKVIGNGTHASLAQTAFSASFLPQIEAILGDSEDPYVDMRIWEEAGRRSKLFVDNETSLYLGVKGMSGRKGIGTGHNPMTYRTKDGEDRAVLKNWAPGDYHIYLDILSGALTDENCDTYFSSDLSITGVVVSCNTKDLVERSYMSVRKFHPDMPIIIVDGSTPNSPCANYVQSLSSEVTTILSPGYNIGHGRGMCLGLEHTKTPYALIFDSDIEMLESPVDGMLAMMEADTFGVGCVEEKSAYDGFEWGSPGHKNPGEWMRYLHPMFQLVSVANYKKFHPYVHHGAPCYLTMLDIHRRGLSDKILKQFPGLGHTGGSGWNWEPVPAKYIRHDTRGTRDARLGVRLPEIESGWMIKRLEDLPCIT